MAQLWMEHDAAAPFFFLLQHCGDGRSRIPLSCADWSFRSLAALSTRINNEDGCRVNEEDDEVDEDGRVMFGEERRRGREEEWWSVWSLDDDDDSTRDLSF